LHPHSLCFLPRDLFAEAQNANDGSRSAGCAPVRARFRPTLAPPPVPTGANGQDAPVSKCDRGLEAKIARCAARRWAPPRISSTEGDGEQRRRSRAKRQPASRSRRTNRVPRGAVHPKIRLQAQGTTRLQVEPFTGRHSLTVSPSQPPTILPGPSSINYNHASHADVPLSERLRLSTPWPRRTKQDTRQLDEQATAPRRRARTTAVTITNGFRRTRRKKLRRREALEAERLVTPTSEAAFGQPAWCPAPFSLCCAPQSQVKERGAHRRALQQTWWTKKRLRAAARAMGDQSRQHTT